MWWQQQTHNKWNTNPIKQWTGNRIGDKGAMKISESLKTNTTLASLNLWSDGVVIRFSQRNDKQRINWLLTWIQSKQWLGNRIGPEGATKISESLKINSALSQLILSGDDKNRVKTTVKEWKKWTKNKCNKTMRRQQNWRWRSSEDKWIVEN